MHALDTMRALASKAEVIHLNQGDVLFRTGETGTCMYGLLEGSVRLTWIDSAGHEGHEDIPVGHVFGAGALVMEDHQRLSTATATSDCHEPRQVPVCGSGDADVCSATPRID